MHLITGNCQRGFFAVFLKNHFYDVIHNCRINVGYLQVIHVPENCALLPIYHLIHDAIVVGVQVELPLLELPSLRSFQNSSAACKAFRSRTFPVLLAQVLIVFLPERRMYILSSISACIKAPGMSHVATSHVSSASITLERNRDSTAIVGALVSSFYFRSYAAFSRSHILFL